MADDPLGVPTSRAVKVTLCPARPCVGVRKALEKTTLQLLAQMQANAVLSGREEEALERVATMEVE